MKLRLLAACLSLALPLMSCHSDDPFNPPNFTSSNGLMARYVSMGNSITAGFQSAGINDSTQQRSYAAVFAQKANAPFFVPLLNKPGCPAPIKVNSVQPPVLVGIAPNGCALRNPAPLPYLSNVAVPGALVGSLLDNAVAPNALTTFILGGRTQTQAMMAAQPTFVSVWIGNNDVLGALTSRTNPGNPALLTPVSTFQTAYTGILDSVQKTGAKAALMAVADVASIPYATSGATYWCLKTGLCPGIPAAPLPPTFTVQNNCAPMVVGIGAKGDSVLVPWVIAVPRISAAAAGAPTTIDCSVDADVVTPAEFKGLRDAVAGYNAFIASEAQKRNWAYVDLNPALIAYKTQSLALPPAKQLITTFPILPTGPTQPNVLFGTLFSLDGVHPSSLAHRIVADSLISAVNRTYGTAIPFAGQ